MPACRRPDRIVALVRRRVTSAGFDGTHCVGQELPRRVERSTGDDQGFVGVVTVVTSEPCGRDGRGAVLSGDAVHEDASTVGDGGGHGVDEVREDPHQVRVVCGLRVVDADDVVILGT